MTDRKHTTQHQGRGKAEPAAEPQGAEARTVEAQAGQTGAAEVEAAPQAPAPAEGDQLATVARERDEYLDHLRRLKAEFDNYRKRVARDQHELAARAHERLVRELVPVLDDLERALEFAAAHEEARLEDGVRLVHRALADALAKEGLAEIATDGKFDPHTQEALLSQPSEAEEGTVIQVLQKGYLLGDRVLRPARVVIAAGSTVA
jgi:molecular chaperone GrpE